MAKKDEIVAEFPGVLIIHQKVPSRVVGHHQHDEHEIFIPLQGEIAITYREETFKAGPGRMLYVPPEIEHSFTSSAQGSGERIILLIQEKLWKKHSATERQPCTMPINSLAKELVFYLLIHQQAKGSQYFLSALIAALGESIQGVQQKVKISSSHISGRVSEPRIQRALEILEEEINSISLSDLAERSGLSLRNLNRLFLLHCGLQPKEYLILRKIEKAKELLKETKMTVTDVALEVGYGSLSKFIETFKKHVGCLPSDYRSGLK